MDPRLHSKPPSPAGSLLSTETNDTNGDAASTHGTGTGEQTGTGAGAGVAGRHFHHYEVCLREDGVTLHELGRGAMGVSYKARDVNLDTPVAIKVIGAGLPTQVQARARFRREARAAAQLRHPNVASVFHFGETPAGECFYAMEFIEGETLAARVQREGPLPAALVVEIALQVAAALLAADERGLVHRDLKPANLMLVAPPARGHGRGRGTSTPSTPSTSTASSGVGRGGVLVKVIDFGLAKAAGAADLEGAPEPEAPLTQAGGFLGTPAYASPEQAEGGPVDARSDIYSLGVTLWYLLTARVPFAGRSFSEIYDRQLHRALPLAQLADARVPASLAALLRRMLAAEPARRPASPGALCEALEACRAEMSAGGGAGLPPASGYPARPGPGARRLVPFGRVGRPPWAVAAAMAALLLLVGVLVLAAVGVGTGGWRRRAHAGPGAAGADVPADANAQAAAAAAAPEKSIAVLPLEDLSEDKANGYFADGIQDDVLSSLARIKDLKVISRSSVMGYRDTATRNLREIGRALGVRTVLEGSVRRAPARVLVNVALIDVDDGRQVWSERYDRTLADALTLQGELATEIAAALRATLSPEEKARVEDKPTDNADAYVLYLRAREYQTQPYVLMQDFLTAERLYRQALALDPGFALAHARLSATLSLIYLNFRPTIETHDEARAEAEEALRLRPNSGEGNLARALCFVWTDKNYPAALRELDAAARLLPGDPDIDLYHGGIRRRQGRWREAMASFKRASERDPLNAHNAWETMRNDCSVRDWPAAARDGDRAIALAPDNALLKIERRCIDFWSRGDLAPLRAALAAVPAGFNPDGETTYLSCDAALLGRDFAAAEHTVATSALETIVTHFGVGLPKSYFLGCIAMAKGETARARPLFEAACPAIETDARQFPLNAYRQARLGLLYAFLGRKEEALRLGRRSAELLPESRDAYSGMHVSGLLALIYARTGESDQALALVRRLLRVPGAVLPNFDGSITLNDLRYRWQWDPLRTDPRFRALLAVPEQTTIYQ